MINQSEIIFGDWEVLLSTDDDGDLSIFVSRTDGRKVEDALADISDEKEFGVRLFAE